MIIAVTGHREEDCESERIVREKLRASLDPSRTSVVICGMANGVDLWGADEARLLGIHVWAARPWAGHSPRKQDTELYSTILDYAIQVVNVDDSQEYRGPWVYHKRNEWMVDHATHVLAYWSGKESGGTYACIRYAKKIGRPIRNVY